MLKAHYRSPINYSDAQLEEARSGLVRLYTALAQVPGARIETLDSENPWVRRFTDAMNDDFNTPEAIAVLFDLALVGVSGDLCRRLAHRAHAVALFDRTARGVLSFQKAGRVSCGFAGLAFRLDGLGVGLHAAGSFARVAHFRQFAGQSALDGAVCRPDGRVGHFVLAGDVQCARAASGQRRGAVSRARGHRGAHDCDDCRAAAGLAGIEHGRQGGY